MQYGLLGGKLGHSLSPKIHQLFFEYTGLTGSYTLLETEAEALPERVRAMRESFSGSNVTIPHKIAVMPLLDSIAPEAQAIGAVNTIKFTPQGAFGYNTDYFGFGRMLEYNKIAVSGKVAVVLGSGGAARAVIKYLADKCAAEIYLVTREPSSVDKHFFEIVPALQVIDYVALQDLFGDVIINCTPVGMYPKIEAAPVTENVVANFAAAVDLIYNPVQTLFLKYAQEAGKQYVNGLFMLVAQAVAAQEIWQGQTYASELIVKIMKELEHSL